MGKKHPMFDIPLHPAPEDDEDEVFGEPVADRCNHTWLMVRKDEWRSGQTSMVTRFVYYCPKCVMVVDYEG
jgi:hypothetical protein